MAPRVIAGDITKHDASAFQATLTKAGINRIDTAAVYAQGESEKRIGSSDLSQNFTIDTKILYSPPGDNNLTPEAIVSSLNHSLEVLRVDHVNVLYCHAPDWTTPISVQAKTFDEQYRLGKFKYLGVSNFPSSMLEEWLSIAEKRGYVKPTFFEGMYNPISRGYESTLFPLLRKNNIHFTGYSPMAGGFLLGRGARMSDPNNPFTMWFNKPGMHAAVAKFKELSQSTGLGMDELCMRWLAHHSVLGDEDFIILGASQLEQIHNNVKQVENGPLDQNVVEAINDMWKLCEDDGMAILKTFEKK